MGPVQLEMEGVESMTSEKNKKCTAAPKGKSHRTRSQYIRLVYSDLAVSLCPRDDVPFCAGVGENSRRPRRRWPPSARVFRHGRVAAEEQRHFGNAAIRGPKKENGKPSVNTPQKEYFWSIGDRRFEVHEDAILGNLENLAM